jgi:hypothetical protein
MPSRSDASEIELPPPPSRKFVIFALLVFLAVPLLCAGGVAALAAGIADRHTVTGTEPAAVRLAADEAYIVFRIADVKPLCQIEDPDGTRVPALEDTLDVFAWSYPSLWFETDAAGLYVVTCAFPDGESGLVARADFQNKILVLLALAGLAVFAFAVGGGLLVVALVSRSKAKKRWEAEKREIVAAALAKEKAAGPPRSKASYPEFPQDPVPVYTPAAAPAYPIGTPSANTGSFTFPASAASGSSANTGSFIYTPSGPSGYAGAGGDPASAWPVSRSSANTGAFIYQAPSAPAYPTTAASADSGPIFPGGVFPPATPRVPPVTPAPAPQAPVSIPGIPALPDINSIPRQPPGE